MNPQVLIDGVEHGATGCILLLDNRRMGAISGLQLAQYGADCGTWDRVAVDYVAWASAVEGCGRVERRVFTRVVGKGVGPGAGARRLVSDTRPRLFRTRRARSLGGLWPLERR